MNKLLSLLLLSLVLISCKDEAKQADSTKTAEPTEPIIAKVYEENFDLRKDSIIFNSGTIENFDPNGNSIDVYWIGQERDTVLRFYRKYDTAMNLIGAEYYEEGDTEPSRDTVYFNAEGLKVEASLNAENQISWKSTITPDTNGNPVLKTYENGKGEYRGLDSLFFDSQDRVIKGFYKNSKGKRYSVRTYEYVKSDEKGNWTERKMFKNDTLNQKQVRTITYH
ncbi:hypothetical protein [Gilvibacter sediminis]|uniref:hypothetical protein n=1 Tax=Gilvibacter sediminis TaxID=379071 RepID=UPI00234FBB24|nr:hypothetical protein [Gilvibacter sediminis]MDC7998025.1 hypothetical protein [Gilvibacter sediminis]